ncbi:MAG: T9SS type A sorting domain-containing protein, partial [Bacteroidia bacterium]|nr:T9SS type A sorting domain-containing protein [Bacteroidia bacterium]
VSVYPNPSNSQMTIETHYNIISVAILDAMGRTIYVNFNESNTIDISNLSKGVYLLQIETDEGLSNLKFTKE